MITRDECTTIITPETQDVRLDNLNGDVVGIEPGQYNTLRLKNNEGVIVVNLGHVEFVSNLVTNFRNCKDTRLLGNNIPDIPQGIRLFAGMHIFDIYSHEQTRDVAVEGLYITARDQSFSSIKVTPRKSLNGIISGVTIRNNRVFEGRSGFYVGGPDWLSPSDHQGLVRDVLIERNHLYRTGDAIQIKSCLSGGVIRHNYVEQARLIISSSQSGVGFFAGPNGGKIHDNEIIASEGDGIHISPMVKGDAEIYRNLVVLSGTGDDERFQSGIQIGNDRSVVHHNHIFNSRQYGVNIRGVSDRSEVYDNRVLWSGLAPIKQGGSPEENFYRNHTSVGSTPDYFDIGDCDCTPEPPQPEPPPEPRYWALGMRLTMIDDRLSAGDVFLSEE